jgi:hypothetical protein
MTARTLSFVLALWEFFAAFAIPRTRPSFAAAWTLGLLGAVLAVVGMFRARARWGTLAVGVAILASAFVLHHRSHYAWWNDVIAGAALALLSLVPGTMYSLRRSRVPA